MALSSRNDARSRWSTDEGSKLAAEVWQRLRAGNAFDDLPLDHVEGKIDLRGFTAPKDMRPRIATYEIGGLELDELGGESPRALHGVELVSLDLSDSDLRGFHIKDCRIRDCRFDRGDLRDGGMWLTSVEACTFVGANLDNAQIGAWGLGDPEGPRADRGDSFRGCDFSRASMRRLFCDAGEFIDCVFDETRIEDVDFGSTSFIHCRFSGTLRRVKFNAYGFDSGKATPNPMDDVDLSAATLEKVGFYRLDLSGVRLPEGPQYLHFRRYSRVLSEAVAELSAADDQRARALAAYLKKALERQGDDQDRGMLNVDDLGDDEDERAFARYVLERARERVDAG